MKGGGIERARVQTTVSRIMHSPECLQHCARQPDRTRLPSALPSMRGERSGGRKRGGCPTSIDAPGERGPDPTSARPSKDLVRRARLPLDRVRSPGPRASPLLVPEDNAWVAEKGYSRKL